MNELIYGNEPYLIAAYLKKVIKGLVMPEFNLLQTEQFTEVEQDFARNMPFFSERRILVLKINKLISNKLLEKYLKNPTKSTDIYLVAQEIDKRLSLYKEFKEDNIKKFDKNSEKLQNWILGYIKKQNCKITHQAYKEFVVRINYELEEINFYSIETALRRLCSTEKEITIDLVKKVVQVNEKEDIFQLIQLINQKKMKELFHQINLIIQNNQNIIATLSLLLYSYRILYKMNYGYSQKEIGVYYKTYIPQITKKQANDGICIIQETINKIKSGIYKDDFALYFCIAKLTQLKTM